MTQIPDLLNEFDMSMAVITQRLNAPQMSESEQKLTAELGEVTQKMTALEGNLAEQQTNYLSLSEEYGEMELSLQTLEKDDSANAQNAALTEQLDGLKAASDEKIAQLSTEANDLRTQLNAALAKESEMQDEQNASQTNALDDLKEQHSKDIAQVQNILNQLKPLVEE